MNSYKIIAILVLSISSLFSCQKVLEIDANSLPQKIVIDGTINSGEIPQVIIRNSGFLYDTIDLEKTYIHNAIVEVSDGVTSTTLTEKCFKIYNKLDSLLADNDSINQTQFLFQMFLVDVEEMDSLYEYYFHLSPEEFQKSQLICVYSSFNIFNPFLGEEGKTYTLKVTDGDRVVTSTTTIPESFTVDSLSSEKNIDDSNFSEVFVHVTFPPELSLGHYVQFGSKTQSTQYYYGMRQGSVYSDAFFEGSNVLKLPLEGRSHSENRPPSAKRMFAKGDTVTLIWKNIDKPTYNFLYTAENDGGASPFSSPVKIISNIEGGLGVWAGYNISTESIYIP